MGDKAETKDFLDSLIEAIENADMNTFDGYFVSPAKDFLDDLTTSNVLHHAALHGRQEMLKKLLAVPGTDPNIPFRYTSTLGLETPLHTGLRAGEWTCVRILLDVGADPKICGYYKPHDSDRDFFVGTAKDYYAVYRKEHKISDDSDKAMPGDLLTRIEASELTRPIEAIARRLRMKPDLVTRVKAAEIVATDIAKKETEFKAVTDKCESDVIAAKLKVQKANEEFELIKLASEKKREEAQKLLEAERKRLKAQKEFIKPGELGLLRAQVEELDKFLEAVDIAKESVAKPRLN